MVVHDFDFICKGDESQFLSPGKILHYYARSLDTRRKQGTELYCLTAREIFFYSSPKNNGVAFTKLALEVLR